MSVTYLVQFWDKESRKYQDFWTGWDYSEAVAMFNKLKFTRRLVRFEIEVIQKARAGK
jgi:hypothetical protein